MPHETDPLHRFTSRVDDYVRFRPGYPDALFDCLRAETGMTPSWPVADVGPGAGIFSRALLGNGNRVHGEGYAGVDHRHARARIGEFLGPHSAHTFEHMPATMPSGRSIRTAAAAPDYG